MLARLRGNLGVFEVAETGANVGIILEVSRGLMKTVDVEDARAAAMVGFPPVEDMNLDVQDSTLGVEATGTDGMVGLTALLLLMALGTSMNVILLL